MQLTIKFNNRFRFLLCVIDIYSKYTWVVPLNDKKDSKITNTFQKVLDESGLKPNTILIDRGSEFNNGSVKSWFKDNNIEMYSARNEGKSAAAENFFRTLKNKIYKYMTSVSKNVYIDKLDDIVNKYNVTYYRSIKMKPIDVKSSTYIDFGIEKNDKNPKFKVSDHVRISKHKSIFAKVHVSIWSEEVFAIKKVRNTVPWICFIKDLYSDNIDAMFYGKRIAKEEYDRV